MNLVAGHGEPPPAWPPPAARHRPPFTSLS
jgi:hypothetical protein